MPSSIKLSISISDTVVVKKHKARSKYVESILVVRLLVLVCYRKLMLIVSGLEAQTCLRLPPCGRHVMATKRSWGTKKNRCTFCLGDYSIPHIIILMRLSSVDEFCSLTSKHHIYLGYSGHQTLTQCLDIQQMCFCLWCEQIALYFVSNIFLFTCLIYLFCYFFYLFYLLLFYLFKCFYMLSVRDFLLYYWD